MIYASDTLPAIVSACFCGALILVRDGYRLLYYCRVHKLVTGRASRMTVRRWLPELLALERLSA